MHYKTSLILACASLTLLASAAPQSNAAATGAVAKSTLTQTKVATATVGGADPATATGAVGGGGVGAGVGTGSDVAGGASDYDTSGAGAGGAPGAAGADGSMPPASSGAGAGMSENGPPEGKGFPGGGDWEQFDGRGGPGGDKGPFWAKFSGSNGHPHQPVARDWSGWLNGGAGKEQGGEKGPDMMGMKEGASVAGHGQGHMLRARGDVLTGGPSWAHVRDGVIGSVKVARSMPMGGQGKGGMSYGEERQDGSRWGGYGQ